MLVPGRLTFAVGDEIPPLPPVGKVSLFFWDGWKSIDSEGNISTVMQGEPGEQGEQGPPGVPEVDSGYALPGNGADKGLSLANYLPGGADFTGTDTVNQASVEVLAAQVILLTKVVQAMLGTFFSGKIPGT